MEFLQALRAREDIFGKLNGFNRTLVDGNLQRKPDDKGNIFTPAARVMIDKLMETHIEHIW